jgi:hypothetical protein
MIKSQPSITMTCHILLVLSFDNLIFHFSYETLFILHFSP